MLRRDFYDVLGVSETASDKEIKQAYRKLARDNHPDTHVGDKIAEEIFRQAAEAYEVLGDADTRARYDSFPEEFTRASSLVFVVSRKGTIARMTYQKCSSEAPTSMRTFSTYA